MDPSSRHEAVEPMAGIDRDAFSVLYREQVDRVTSFAARTLFSPGDVADLVAATFLVALERWGSYDLARGEPAAWLLGIAANLAANQRRRQVRETLARARLDARALLSPDDVEALVARLDASAEAARLRAVFDTLSDAHRQVLLLAGESSLSAEWAARAAGISPSAFRVRLLRARRALPGHAIPDRGPSGGGRPYEHAGGPHMTPTTNAFEDRLHDALIDRFDALSPQLSSSPLRPLRRFPARRMAIPVGALAAAASVWVLILDLGGGVPTGTARTGGPAVALAAWTSQPTPANQGETPGAEAQCSAALNAPGRGAGSRDKAPPPPPAGGPWNPVLVDTRADLALALYSDGTTWIACLDTPSFIQVNALGTNSEEPVPESSATLDKLSTKGTSGSVYTVAIGTAGSSVTGVILHRTDGSAVAATLGNGHYIAWWPGTEGVTALSATSGTGTQTVPVDQRFAQPNQPGNRTVHELPPTSPSQ